MTAFQVHQLLPVSRVCAEWLSIPQMRTLTQSHCLESGGFHQQPIKLCVWWSFQNRPSFFLVATYQGVFLLLVRFLPVFQLHVPGVMRTLWTWLKAKHHGEGPSWPWSRRESRCQRHHNWMLLKWWSTQTRCGKPPESQVRLHSVQCCKKNITPKKNKKQKSLSGGIKLWSLQS